MPKVGRNDPCSCGSGKKYKKCCLPKNAAASQPVKDHHEQCVDVVSSLSARLMSFAKKQGYNRHVQAASERFQNLTKTAEDLEGSEQVYISFLEWFLHDYALPELNKAPVQLYLESNPPLTVEERKLLEDWQGRVISAYQVDQVEAGQGLTVKPILDEANDLPEYFLSDRAISRKAKPGDVLVARVFLVVDEYHLSSEVSMGETKLKKPFLAKVELALAQFRQDNPEASTKDFLRALGFNLPTLLMEAHDEVFSPPHMLTTSGEEPIFMEARYHLLDRAQAIERLKSSQDFEFEYSEADIETAGEIRFVWLEKAESSALMREMEKSFSGAASPEQKAKQFGAGSRLLGKLSVKESHLTLSAVGWERFAAGKKRLEEILAGLATHRLDSMQPLEAALAKLGPPPGPASRPKAQPGKFAPLMPGETIHEALKNRSFQSIDDMNDFLAQASAESNARPQEDMGGLSPDQVRKLLSCDWEDEYGPIRLNRSLPLAELRTIPVLHNARLLLSLCQAQGGVKATPSGYLGTAFVRQLVGQMLRPAHADPDDIVDLGANQIREADVHELRLLRAILELAGLLRREKSKFVVSEKGKALLAEAKAGDLFAGLFVAFFSVMDLDGLDPMENESPFIQETMAYTFHALTKLPADGTWLKLKDVVPSILLPAVKHALTSKENHQDWDENDLGLAVDNMEWRVVGPLYQQFGLLEWQENEQEDDVWEMLEVRPTPLLGKFISFTFE